VTDKDFSVPPRAAKRLALSLEMRASSPMRTSAVFSDTPVSLPASLSRRGSILSVVLICTMMHVSGILVNPLKTYSVPESHRHPAITRGMAASPPPERRRS